MMAFENGFVASIIVQNKPTREFNEEGRRTAVILFDSEYAIRVINRHKTLRAKVEIDIDGTPVLSGGKSLLLGPNETIDLERFVDDFNKGKKFKFVPLSNGGVQDPTSKENGKIVLKFWREADLGPQLKTLTSHSLLARSGILRSKGINFDSACVNSGGASLNGSASFSVNCSGGPDTVGHAFVSNMVHTSSAGATVEGSESDQKFIEGADFAVDSNATVMQIFLRGPAAAPAKAVKVWELMKGPNHLGILLFRGNPVDLEIVKIDETGYTFTTSDFEIAMRWPHKTTKDGFLMTVSHADLR